MFDIVGIQLRPKVAWYCMELLLVAVGFRKCRTLYFIIVKKKVKSASMKNRYTKCLNQIEIIWEVKIDIKLIRLKYWNTVQRIEKRFAKTNGPTCLGQINPLPQTQPGQPVTTPETPPQNILAGNVNMIQGKSLVNKFDPVFSKRVRGGNILGKCVIADTLVECIQMLYSTDNSLYLFFSNTLKNSSPRKHIGNITINQQR